MEGFDDESGKRVFLHPMATAAGLRAFSSVWSEDSGMKRRLISWLADESVNTQHAGLVALERAQLDDGERQQVADALAPLIAGAKGSDVVFSVPRIVRFVLLRGLSAQLERELRGLVDTGAPSAVPAACALTTVVDAKAARAVSVKAALAPVGWRTFEGLDRDELRRLVRLAPREWTAAVASHFEDAGPFGIALIAPVFDVLANEDRRSIAMALRDKYAGFFLPWLRDDVTDKPYRPADLIDRFLFDVGAS
jgi:hypothetical protein